MGRIAALVGFGIGLIGFGLFYRLMDDILTTYFTQFIQDNFYYTASDLVWDMLPWVAILLGVVCIVTAGIASRSRTVMVE